EGGDGGRVFGLLVRPAAVKCVRAGIAPPHRKGPTRHNEREAATLSVARETCRAGRRGVTRVDRAIRASPVVEDRAVDPRDGRVLLSIPDHSSLGQQIRPIEAGLLEAPDCAARECSGASGAEDYERQCAGCHDGADTQSGADGTDIPSSLLK